jgi:predicted Zn-dependent protease
MKRQHPVAAASALAIVVLLTACFHTSESTAKALVSDEQEKQLGAQVKQELDKQGTKYVQDREVVSYVQGVANRIFVPATKDRRRRLASRHRRPEAGQRLRHAGRQLLRLHRPADGRGQRASWPVSGGTRPDTWWHATPSGR